MFNVVVAIGGLALIVWSVVCGLGAKGAGWKHPVLMGISVWLVGNVIVFVIFTIWTTFFCRIEDIFEITSANFIIPSLFSVALIAGYPKLLGLIKDNF